MSRRSVFEPARSGPQGDSTLDDMKWCERAVQRELELASQAPCIARLSNLCSELVGRDLGQVERVANVDVAPRDLDAGVPVDREVAERMRTGRGGCGEKHGHGCEGGD